MPIIDPPPPSPIEGESGHFPWTDWVTNGLELIETTPIIATGRNTVNPVANTVTALVVTFPVGRFTVPPVVVATPDTGQYGASFVGHSIAGVTATQFTMYVLRTNTQATGIFWLAVESVQ